MKKLTKDQQEFWESLGNCCGAKIKYEILDNGMMRHTCRGCGEVLWSKPPSKPYFQRYKPGVYPKTIYYPDNSYERYQWLGAGEVKYGFIDETDS